jgi:CPA1 family monovalent cation:H+ antiporter
MTTGVVVTPLDAAAILIVLAAAFGYANQRFFHLPQSVGLTIMGALASLTVVGIERLFPGSQLGALVLRFIDSLDFQTTLMDGMLSFLLFAGALQVDWSAMRRGLWPVLVLSTVGVALSTGLVGGGLYFVAQALGLAVPFVWCLVLGALISPTDPVAVMGVLKAVNVSPTLSATVAGESLFNDGVGVVIFSILLTTALGSEAFSVGHAARLFAIEAGGGIALGLVAGWLAYGAMQSIDEYNVEVMLTLAVVMGGYALAHVLRVSGPVAMAVAGLVIGNHGVTHAMSETTRDYLLKFWSLIDEILNAVLFLLIGLVVVIVPYDPRLILAGVIAIPLTLAARTVSVLLPLLGLRPFMSLGPLAPPTLIWGGLRGGISIALALSLPNGQARPIVLTVAYVIVLFSVIVQGGTVGRVIARFSDGPRGA